MNNIELFLECLRYPEKFTDKDYTKESIIITSNKSELNNLLLANNEIIEKITAYKVALEFHDETMCNGIIIRLIKLLTVNGINNSEFSNYWGIHDISFSIYENLSLENKIEFLKDMLAQYIESRHNMYQSHGYTGTTLQVRSDSVAHKRSGELGSNKAQKIFDRCGFLNSSSCSLEEFMNIEKGYILADKGGSHLFDKLISNKIIDFDWGRNHQGKRPDFAFKNHGELFIVEHKHMKEGGGGQNKQMVEVIDFIKQSEVSIHYIIFLDGIFFNSFIGHQDRKLKNQYTQILKALESNPNNYFINTFGFEYLLLS